MISLVRSPGRADMAAKADDCLYEPYHIISMFVCVRVCVCVCAFVSNGRSPEVIRPLAKFYFFLWAMATVGQREGAQ